MVSVEQPRLERCGEGGKDCDIPGCFCGDFLGRCRLFWRQQAIPCWGGRERVEDRQILVVLLPHFFWKMIFLSWENSPDIKALPKIKAGICF